ncbi:MAG: YfcE family phosphodiesterase [Clostridia bacterium]|nr:YfcE family phosphodiesterase [Clostridia bacterium]
MILLVFSDSHGTTYGMDEAIEKENVVNGIIFCGDVAADAEYLRRRYPNIPICAVCGNNDYFCDDPYVRMPTYDGIKMYVTHGHKERVKGGLTTLLLNAKRNECSVCLFGHTHQSLFETIDGITLINPGSIRSSNGTYARLEIINGKLTTEIRRI